MPFESDIDRCYSCLVLKHFYVIMETETNIPLINHFISYDERETYLSSNRINFRVTRMNSLPSNSSHNKPRKHTNSAITKPFLLTGSNNELSLIFENLVKIVIDSLQGLRYKILEQWHKHIIYTRLEQNCIYHLLINMKVSTFKISLKVTSSSINN